MIAVIKSNRDRVFEVISSAGQIDQPYYDVEAIGILTGLRDSQIYTAIHDLRAVGRLPKGPGKGRHRGVVRPVPTLPACSVEESRRLRTEGLLHGERAEPYRLPSCSSETRNAVAIDVERWKTWRRRAVPIHTYIEESRARDSGKAAMVRVDVMVSEGEGVA